MTTKEALQTRPWFREAHLTAWEADAAVEDFERALREAYREGFGQAKDGFLKPDSEYGVTAGVAEIAE